MKGQDEREQEEMLILQAIKEMNSSLENREWWVGTGVNLRAMPLGKTFKFKFFKHAVNDKQPISGTEAASVGLRVTPGLSHQ